MGVGPVQFSPFFHRTKKNKVEGEADKVEDRVDGDLEEVGACEADDAELFKVPWRAQRRLVCQSDCHDGAKAPRPIQDRRQANTPNISMSRSK